MIYTILPGEITLRQTPEEFEKTLNGGDTHVYGEISTDNRKTWKRPHMLVVNEDTTPLMSWVETEEDFKKITEDEEEASIQAILQAISPETGIPTLDLHN